MSKKDNPLPGAEATQAALLEAVAARLPDTVLLTDSAGQPRRVLGDSAALLGVPSERLRPDSLMDAVHGGDRERLRALLSGHIALPEDTAIPLRLSHADGSLVHAEGFVRDATGDPALAGRLLFLRRRSRIERRDPMTGLPGRATLLERMTARRGQAPGGPWETRRGAGDPLFGVLLVELERYEPVRATFGDQAADAMAAELGRRLVQALPIHWMVARAAPGLFAVLASDLRDAGQAARVAGRLGRCASPAFQVQGQQVASAVAIGVALSNRRHRDAEAMLLAAESSLARARRGGGGPQGTGSGGSAAQSAALQAQMHRVELARELREALGRQQLDVFYQPVCSLADRRVQGFEALLRWNHPTLGVVAPAQFLPLAEESGWIVELGEWVLRQGLAQLPVWREMGPRGAGLGLSVNVSAKQLVSGQLVDRVEAALRSSGVEPGRLTLEVTETALMDRPGDVLAELRALKELGVRLALDDFGTGYCALAYLQRFPIDSLKIDRSFVSGVAGIGQSDSANGLVRAILGLAETLGLDVIAEGVETPEQARLLAEMGCARAQGFLLGRPLPAERALQLLGRQAA